jgi:arylsulfatase A-like enzyme
VPAGREAVVVLDEYGPVRMIRTREWKAVHRYPYGPHELYHLTEDPDEARNLADLPEHRRIYAELLGLLEEWFRQRADPDRDGVREAVTGNGQLGRVGPGGRTWPRFA